MEALPDRIFISYSRADGREFAEAFEGRLVDEGIRSWRDLKSMEGDDIRPQVLRAIEKVEHFVLILTRRALESAWVQREWSHARLLGRKVSPILADRSIKRSELPRWIRRAEVFDIAEPERWRMLVRVLEAPGETRRISFWSGDLPKSFVLRPTEYEKLKKAVLTAKADKPGGTTIGLVGAGGYGKTTLANALCRDEDVRFNFDDGILRVEVGKEREDVTGLVVDLIEQQTGKRPGFQNVQAASEHLAEVINEARLLLVIDDVWQEAKLRPFLRGGPNCVRLVTTRVRQALQESPYTRIDIDEMRTDEAVSLLSVGLTGTGVGAVQHRLPSLAKRLGHWAQLLDITNGWVRGWISDGGSLGDAIVEFTKRLDDAGLTALDAPDETQRNRAIRLCIEASLQDEKASDLARFCELAVLPSSEATPLSAVEALWSETGGLKRTNSVDLVRRFHSRSLVQHLNLKEGAQEVRLHENMIWYLRDRIGADGYCAAHAAMIRAIRRDCGETWDSLPVDHKYGWQHLIRHLRGAGRDEEADRLLTNYPWIKAKLRASSARGLFDSYSPDGHDQGVRLVGRAIALSLPALAANPHELPRQLFGRLGGLAHTVVAGLVASAQQDPDFRPAPRWPGLTPPGAERLRLVGHEDLVSSASFSPDGGRIVTASNDRTARIWDATTGQEIIVLRGHGGSVRSASFSPDGGRIVTGSEDHTARIWNATTGQEILALRGHQGSVRNASFSPDGARIATGSEDRTARIWDATTGHEITRIALDALVTGLSVYGGTIAVGDGLGRIHVFESEGFLTAKDSASG